MNAGQQDQVVRMVPLVLNVQGAIVPSLGVETLRVAAEAGLTLSRLHSGLLRLSFDQVDVRLQDDGRRFALLPGAAQVMRVFDITGMRERLEFVSDVGEVTERR